MTARDRIITAQIKQAVQKADPTATAILFGSRATGMAREDSDWDVLILVDKPVVSVKDEQIFRYSLYDLELEINEVISTFVYAEKDWNNRTASPLYQSIKEEGILL